MLNQGRSWENKKLNDTLYQLDEAEKLHFRRFDEIRNFEPKHPPVGIGSRGMGTQHGGSDEYNNANDDGGNGNNHTIDDDMDDDATTQPGQLQDSSSGGLGLDSPSSDDGLAPLR